MPSALSEAMVGVLPIMALIGLGVALQRSRLLDAPTVAGIKRIIVSIALPAVLFSTFVSLSFAAEHLFVVLTVFTVCVALLGVGYALRDAFAATPYSPFLFTGFELGMLGFALFTAVYGTDRLPALGVLALGHEVFIWFVYASLLRTVGAQRRPFAITLREVASSPVVVAIVAGILVNVAGLGSWVTDGAIGSALRATLHHLAGVIIPLVLLIIGFESRLSKSGVRAALPLVLTRLALAIPAAVLLGHGLFTRVLDLDSDYAHAMVTLMVLPPPFIVPLFIAPERRADTRYTTNVLSLYSLASVAVFAAYVVISGSTP